MLDKIKSEVAYLYATLLISGLCFAKAFIPTFPIEQAIGSIGGLTVLFFTKKRVQQWMNLKFNNNEEEKPDA